jgi:HK97 family phage prohead protease
MSSIINEYKTLKQNIQVKSAESHLNIKGYAAVYDSVDNDNDIIVHGAFTNSCTRANLPLLWQHEPKHPIGVINRLQEDERGLLMDADIITSSIYGSEASAMLLSGAVDGLSVGFIIDDFYQRNDVRYITKATLMEVSLVTFPANAGAVVTCVNTAEHRSCLEAIASLRAGLLT